MPAQTSRQVFDATKTVKYARPARTKDTLRPSVSGYAQCKSGHREDLNLYVRSSWEANYARYLNLLVRMGVVAEWKYEPETFWFEAIRRGVRSYKPDFRVVYVGDATPVYVELKGYMDAKSKTKIKRMAIYHPGIKLEIVSGKEYRALQSKWKSSIPTWE